MSIFQFFRILWARRFIILGATAFGIIASLLVVLLTPPQYKAESRVMLDIIKPDPITGQVMSTSFLRAYTKTQIELIQDFKVASRVAEDLGWANDPKMLKKYEDRPRADTRDFTRWAAQVISDGTKVTLIEGSNILDMTYTSDDPNTAQQVVEALRKAYADITLQSRQETARRNADWYDLQATKGKAVLFAAEAAKSQFERENGIILQDNKVDIDSARLSALAGVGLEPMMAPAAGQVSGASMQLAQLDAEIGEASKNLGPNHPQLIAMKGKRTLLAQAAATEQSASSMAATASQGAARATAGLLDTQKRKVMAQRDKVERLRLLQDEVEMRRGQYSKAVARSAELRQEADVADTGVTPLGNAVTPTEPSFPNKPLLLIGGLLGGAGLGTLAAILLEILGRRVRSVEDLRIAVGVPVLAVISNPDVKPRRTENFLRTMMRRSRRVPVRTARA